MLEPVPPAWLWGVLLPLLRPWVLGWDVQGLSLVPLGKGLAGKCPDPVTGVMLLRPQGCLPSPSVD